MYKKVVEFSFTQQKIFRVLEFGVFVFSISLIQPIDRPLTKIQDSYWLFVRGERGISLEHNYVNMFHKTDMRKGVSRFNSGISKGNFYCEKCSIRNYLNSFLAELTRLTTLARIRLRKMHVKLMGSTMDTLRFFPQLSN